MYCRKCGNIIADDAAFCSYCGTPTAAEPVVTEVPEEAPQILEAEPAPEPVVEPVNIEPEPEESVIRKPIFDEFQWNVNDYPDNSTFEKTEDIDFDWNADPNDIRDRYSEPEVEPEPAVETPAPAPAPEPEEMSAAERIDKFYTFNRKNEEFQQLLNRDTRR